MSLQQEAGRRETLQYIVNHVFLPPQLPQNDNDETLENEVALVEECHTALLAFIEVSNDRDRLDESLIGMDCTPTSRLASLILTIILAHGESEKMNYCPTILV